MKKDIEVKLNVMKEQVRKMEKLSEEMQEKRIQLDTQKGMLGSIIYLFK